MKNLMKGDNEFNESGYYFYNTKQYWEGNIFAYQKNFHISSSIHAQQIELNIIFDDDYQVSRLIDNFILKIKCGNNEYKYYELGEVDPAQLYWLGKAFLKIARHFKVKEGEKYDEQEV